MKHNILTMVRSAPPAARSSASPQEAMMELVPVAIVALAPDGRVSYANPTWLALAAQLSGSAMTVGSDYLAAVTAADASNGAQIRRRLESVLAGTLSGADMELRLGHGRGARCVQLSAHHLPQGGAVITERDISALRVLRDERDRLVALSQASSDCILLFLPQGRIEYMNAPARALAQTVGAVDESGEVLDRIDRWPHSLVGDIAIDGALATGVWRGELHLESRDGRELVLQANVHVIPGADPARPYCAALLRDLTAEKASEAELHNRHIELELAYSKLKGAQEQLLQSEKLASIGQLAAGVAHEINNPIGYVHSNLGSLQEYMRNLFSLIDGYEAILRGLGQAEVSRQVEELGRRFDLAFLVQDLPQLLSESRAGIERVKKIVQDLKDFSYAGRSEEWTLADLHKGLESTINIVWNELKYKVELKKEYGELPLVECLPMQLNQVFMNLLVNAGHAIAERGSIEITTAREGDEVVISVHDDGIGMSPAVLAKIFDPFFTTKPVGHGTGLGLSLSYGIVQKHHGRIEVASTVGAGTTFRVVLPIQQPRA